MKYCIDIPTAAMHRMCISGVECQYREPTGGKIDLSNPCSGGQYRIATLPNMPRRSSQHCYYRGFWIRNVSWNRTIVDNFLSPQAADASNTVPFSNLSKAVGDHRSIAKAARGLPASAMQVMLNFVAIYAQLRVLLSDVKKTSGAVRNALIRRTMRALIDLYVEIRSLFDAGYMMRLKHVIRDKTLELCAQGISEAFLAFSVFFPTLCTSEIQPWFNFSSLHYSDAHWYTLKDDRVLRPVAEQVYYLSGFNREWRAELGGWQPCYDGCGDIRCREPTPTWGK